MSLSNTHDIERLLGIFSPWSIKSISLDDGSRSLTIRLNYLSSSRKFLQKIMSPVQEKTGDFCFWHHLSLGNRYQTYLVARRTDVADYYRDNPSVKPAFLGSVDKNYSHSLAQSTGQLLGFGLDTASVGTVLCVDQKTVATIKADVDAAASADESDTHLVPAQNDPIWLRLLQKDLQLETNSVPLRLLISKLCAEVSGAEDHSSATEKCITDLRSFFVKNAGNLPRELEQLSGPLQAKRKPRKFSLLLAGESNPIWLDIIKGDFDLESNSLSLNFFLTRLRQQFRQQPELQGSLSGTLRDYFKQNQKQLLSELKVMTLAIRSKKYSASTVSIPSLEHPIWMRLLKDKMLSPKSLNFKLLLGNLRAALGQDPTEDMLLSAATKLRKFVETNRISLKQEFIRKSSVAA